MINERKREKEKKMTQKNADIYFLACILSGMHSSVEKNVTHIISTLLPYFKVNEVCKMCFSNNL